MNGVSSSVIAQGIRRVSQPEVTARRENSQVWQYMGPHPRYSHVETSLRGRGLYKSEDRGAARGNYPGGVFRIHRPEGQ